ncbi:MAG TPA: DUF512 domain-containing protein [Clostridia bacterium]|nr:DUF512 domain-containing protein [Clostridia bacterium]HOL60327.1 DUF512 domain-containing protein [Clostridia bacterium]HPO53084.1 DUF512 domain-containing protein [Clostridia bacterium]
MAKIVKVDRGGLAKSAGIRKGDELIAVNGRKFRDLIDYAYAEGQSEYVLTIKDKNGAVREVEIKKESDFDYLGLEFDDSAEIKPRCCRNNCLFCFVDQLPEGMRDTLYVKDDDYRLSFTCGCYITGTNLTDKDIIRIIEYKLSPMYFSVHATDEQVRRRLLGVKGTAPAPVMDILKRLTEAGIKINTQVVLCPGINDGEVLKKTIEDLRSLGENIVSLAVVPVGLTGHREGLPELRLLTKEEASATIDMVEACYEKFGGFCYCSDEMYLQAGRDVKDAGYYGSFDQIENGVGLIAKLISEVKEALEFAPSKVNKRVAFITGEAGVYALGRVAAALKEKWRKLKIDIYPIRNDFFGHSVTVSGLVTAGDIINQLKGVDFSQTDHILIPSVMLKEFDTVFLDGISLAELEKALGKKVLVSAVDGECLVDTIAYGE